MKMKKLLAMLSALCMCAVYLPLTEQAIPETVQIIVNAEDSGTCGENLTWVLDDEGTLTISGTGEMEDWNLYATSHSPWKENENIKKAIIEDGVTSISDYAFYDCTGLTEIIIPESITRIGAGAFTATPWLSEKRKENPLVIINNILVDGMECGKEVTIPDGVTSIADSAFSAAYRLESVVIPDTVTSIGERAFSWVATLTSVTIPESVTTIGVRAFLYTPWLEEMQKENPLVIINDILIDAYTCKGDVIIPDNVKTIVDGAFVNNEEITSVTIPDSVVNLGCAFSGCTSLTSVTIPSSVTNIEQGTFNYCTSLTSVTIENGVTSIGERAFWGCSALTSLTIPDSVMSIGKNAFADCSNLKSVTIPDSVMRIGEYAFYSCSGLEDLTISNGVEIIENAAFAGCAVTSVTIPESVVSIGGFAFGTCPALNEIIIKNPDCEIGDYGGTISNRYADNSTSRTILSNGTEDSGKAPGSSGSNSSSVVSNNYQFDGTIYGYADSTAQAYAEKYGYQFALIGSEPDTTEPEELQPGDPTGDGKTSIQDVIVVNKAIMGKASMTDAQLKAVDFNRNNKPDPEESLMMLEYIVGLITDFE